MHHLAATAITSSVLLVVFRSLPCFAISFLSGLLIDLDHLHDYYLQKKTNFKYEHFIQWSDKLEHKYLFLVFHSIEYIIILWLAVYIFKLGVFWIAFCIGFSQHMLLDLIFNNKRVHSLSFYFITIRAIRKFRFQEFKRQNKNMSHDNKNNSGNI